MALDVVTLGEAMLMFVAEEPGPLEQVRHFSKRTAGAETNVAIGLARLGLKVGWQSRLGTDSMARYLLAAIGGEGVDCSRVVCDPEQRTGFMFKGRVDDGSDPPIEYHRKGSAASRLGPDEIDEAWIARQPPPACQRRVPGAVGEHAGRDAARDHTGARSMAARSRSTPTCARRCGRRASSCATR